MAEGAVVPFPLRLRAAECRLLLPALLTLLLERPETDTEENATDDAAREFMLSTLVYCRYKKMHDVSIITEQLILHDREQFIIIITSVGNE